jgi:uncharacterized protein
MTAVLDRPLIDVAAAVTFDTVITHVRQAPLTSKFRYSSRSWLVDLDNLPRLPRGLRWLGGFEARDHLGDPSASLRDNVTRFLAHEGIDVAGGRLMMLANSRALGRAFNPISIHWCYAADGTLAAVIAEVHNTYGDRHAYLLRPDGENRVDAQLDKAMYVSPFNPVDGRYRISVSAPEDRVSVSVRLDRDGQPPFVATLTGERRPSRGVLASAVGSAATSLRVSTLIRWQGIRLFVRGLRVEPRPIHPQQEGV